MWAEDQEERQNTKLRESKGPYTQYTHTPMHAVYLMQCSLNTFHTKSLKHAISAADINVDFHKKEED